MLIIHTFSSFAKDLGQLSNISKWGDSKKREGKEQYGSQRQSRREKWNDISIFLKLLRCKTGTFHLFNQHFQEEDISSGGSFLPCLVPNEHPLANPKADAWPMFFIHSPTEWRSMYTFAI